MSGVEVDALTDVLKTMRPSANTYFCSDFEAPWGMSVDASAGGMFHAVIEGECCLQIEGEAAPIHLEAGDIIAFPTGGAHWICDRPESPRRLGREVVEAILGGEHPFMHRSDNHTAAPASVLLMCGAFQFDSSLDHPFLRDLPCHILLKTRENKQYAWLNALLNVLADESREVAPGSSLTVDKLTEVLFIQLMRAYMQLDSGNMPYMLALLDPQIGRALNLIHSEDKAYWTVKSLGEEVALSRTIFTDKFTRLVGIPPKSYLINWRMQKARALLETSKLTMFSIAESAGYSSEAAFSKAFKQFFDVSPGKVRKSN